MLTRPPAVRRVAAFLIEFERRHALKRGVDRGQHDDRRLAALRVRETRQGSNAAGFDVAVRRDAVVRDAVPRRKGHHLGVRREEFELAPDRRKPLVITRNVQNSLLKRGIGGKPSRDRRKEKGVVPLRDARSHDGPLAAREFIECGWRWRLGGAFLVEGFCFAHHYVYAQNTTVKIPRTLIPEPIKHADFRHGDGNVAGRFMPANPLVDIGIGQRQEVLEEVQPRLIHAWDMLLRITAQDQVQFFRAAMMGAIKRALAFDFKPVHGKTLPILRPDGVRPPSFPQFCRLCNAFVPGGAVNLPRGHSQRNPRPFVRCIR